MPKELAPLLLLAALLLLFYLVVLRPARRQQGAVEQIQRNLAVGDRVVLSAGIFGTIAGLEDARVRLEVAPGTVIEVARRVVVRRVPEESGPDRSEHLDPHGEPPTGPDEPQPTKGS